MEQPATSNCAACGKTQDDVRKLIAVGGPTLCDGCIHAYGAALKHALDEDSRARSRGSMLIAAEEMALDLIDVLESSRAEQAERESQDELDARAPGLRLVAQAEEAMDSPPPPPGDAGTPEEPAAGVREPDAGTREPSAGTRELEAGIREMDTEEIQDEDDGIFEESPAEPPPPSARHCPWCTGSLAPLPGDQSRSHFQCGSCGRQFDIRQA